MVVLRKPLKRYSTSLACKEKPLTLAHRGPVSAGRSLCHVGSPEA